MTIQKMNGSDDHRMQWIESPIIRRNAIEGHVVGYGFVIVHDDWHYIGVLVVDVVAAVGAASSTAALPGMDILDHEDHAQRPRYVLHQSNTFILWRERERKWTATKWRIKEINGWRLDGGQCRWM